MPATGKRYSKIGKREYIDWESNMEYVQSQDPYTGKTKSKLYKVGQRINNWINSIYVNMAQYAREHQRGLIRSNQTLAVGDSRKVLLVSGTTTVTMPSIGSSDRNWFAIKNIGVATVTVSTGVSLILENTLGVFTNTMTISPGQCYKWIDGNSRRYLIT